MDVKLKIYFVLSVALQFARGNNESDVGTQDKPFYFTCKSAPENILSGNYYVGPESMPFMVYCNMTTKETCLVQNSKPMQTSDIYYTGEKTKLPNRFAMNGPFWLNEIGITFTKIYDVKDEQIKWLQEHSSSVRQTLTYRCFNSAAYSSTNSSISVELESWDGVVIGPTPTYWSPLNYNVPIETHHCTGEPYVNTSDIVIESSNAFDLPVKDVKIGDVRHELQGFRIENKELCFK